MDVFDEDAFVVRRSIRILGAAATVVILGAATAWSVGFVALGLWVAWVGLGALTYGWVRSPGGAPEAVHVRADASGLSADGVVDSAGLEDRRRMGAAAAARLPARPRPRARREPRSHRRSGRRAGTRAAARRSRSTRPTYRPTTGRWRVPWGSRGRSRTRALLLALTVAVGIVVGPAVPPIFAVALVALIVLFAGIVVPTRVIVGGDGVLLRWLGTMRFVPWRRVTDVEPFDGGVMLSLGAAGSDEWLTLRMPEEHQRYHPERDAMVERMVSALRSYDSDASARRIDRRARPEPLARLLGRAGGRTRDWVRAMRALVRPVQGFRAASVPVDRLWRIVEDPGADREARTGAAIALAPTLA